VYAVEGVLVAGGAHDRGGPLVARPPQMLDLLGRVLPSNRHFQALDLYWELRWLLVQIKAIEQDNLLPL